jgi:hypothetical protein
MSQGALALLVHPSSDDALGHRDALSNLNHVTHAFNMSCLASTDKAMAVDSANYNESVLALPGWCE